MNNRQRMYVSNRTAREYILNKMECDHVYFKEHLKRKSKFYFKLGNGENTFYQATDFFNLFDGLCFHKGSVCFFQVKTNAWPNYKRITEFLEHKNGFGVFAINVEPKKRNIRVRWYTNELYCM